MAKLDEGDCRELIWEPELGGHPDYKNAFAKDEDML